MHERCNPTHNNVQQEQMKSFLAADGRTLKIEAPIAKPAAVEQKQPQDIPIAIDRNGTKAVKNK